MLRYAFDKTTMYVPRPISWSKSGQWGALGRGVDVKRELGLITEAVSQLRGIQDVVNDVQLGL